MRRSRPTGAQGGCFDTHAWQLAWTLEEFLDFRGEWDDAVRAQRTALAAARRLGDLSREATSLRALGNAYVRLGRFEDARLHLDLALDVERRVGNPVGQAWTHHLCCMLHGSHGQPDQALGHAQEAIRLFQAAGNRRGYAQALNAAG